MKKILFFASALAGLFLAGSCQREEFAPVEENGVVTFEVSIPEVATKAVVDDGSLINKLVYDVYWTDASVETAPSADDLNLLYKGKADVASNGATVISVELMNDKNYVILFWAQRDNTWGVATEGTLLKNGVNFPDSFAANAENIEAFSHVEFLSSKNLAARTKSITLKRPFAQINLGSLLAQNFTINPTTSSMTVKNAGASFDLIKQVAEGKKDVEFTAAAVPGGSLKTDYTYVGMNYIFANGNVEVGYALNTEAGITVTNTVSNVPVAANYRTNIIGKLFTSEAGYSITLEGWGDAGEDMEVITEGLVKNINGDYEISNENGLAYAMNNLMEQEGGNYYLTAEGTIYNMTGIDVTPVDFNKPGLNVYGWAPVVTRSNTEGRTGVTIIGLPYLIKTVANGSNVSISGVTLVNDDNTTTTLINEVQEGATVVVSNCAVGTSTDTSDEISVIIGSGSDYVLDATNVATLANLETALASGVKEINLANAFNFDGKYTLNLNGKKITGLDESTGSFGLININPEANLTIVGPGSIELSATNNRGWNAYSSVVSNQRGTLTVKDGAIIEHLGGTDMAYAIDNLTNTGAQPAVTTIEGATIKSVYRAIRQFLNSTTGSNELYVKAGSKVLGDNKAIWPQDANKNANPGKLVVEEGAEIEDVYLSAASPAKEWPLEISVASSAFVEGGEIVLGTIPVGYEVIEVDGVWTIGQSYAEDGDNLTISSVKGLKDLAANVNGGNNFKGKTIILANDIDLQNETWLCIGTEANPFSGTFDGNGKTIKNLTIIEEEAKEGKAFIGFFGYAKNATIKNATFENVNLNIACLDIDHSQGHIAAVAGSLEGTSTIENVTVKGDIKVESTVTANGASRVAVVAGGNSYGNVTMKNVHVEANEGSYLKANNNLGALAGQLQGKSVFENCSSNIDVTGTKFFAGGIIGLAAGDQTFTNCHTTGDVTILAGREGRANDHYRVGGIAGGWADGKTKVCTLTDCSYTGEISGTNADGSVADPLDYAGYVGRGYTLANCAGSKVVIDGDEYIQAYDDVYGHYIVNGELVVNSAAALRYLASNVNSGKTTFEGVTVKLGADIDLNNEEWTPIGSAYVDHGFMGNFDGNGKTIKNLRITDITPDSDGYVYAGLFGVTEGTATEENYIGNLVIENVHIDLDGHIVSAAIAYPYYTTVENVTVKGDISIKGGDYTSGALAYTRRCVNAKNISVAGKGGSTIEGNKTIGGVISDIQMNGGLTANYSNFSASGLTIKGIRNVGGISGIISSQTLNGATVQNVHIESEYTSVGIVGGAKGDNNSFVENVTYASVTGTNSVIGDSYGKDLKKVSTADELVEALEANEGVYFMNDIKIDPANMSNAYGKTGINVKNGQTIDGNGKTLNIKGAGGTWDSGINTTGGLIKNLTVTGSFRGIFINHTSTHSEKVVLENVTIGGNGTVYTISCDQGLNQGIEATNCTFNGWTSFAATAGEAKFINCSFGEGSGYKYCRPYSNTEFVNCTFCPGYEVDETQATVTFTNCTWEE